MGLKLGIMTINDFIIELSLIKPELREKDVFVRAENGLLLTPCAKFILKNELELILDSEHVSSCIITFE